MPLAFGERAKKSTFSKKKHTKSPLFRKMHAKKSTYSRKARKKSTFVGKAPLPPQIQTWLRAWHYGKSQRIWTIFLKFLIDMLHNLHRRCFTQKNQALLEIPKISYSTIHTVALRSCSRKCLVCLTCPVQISRNKHVTSKTGIHNAVWESYE